MLKMSVLINELTCRIGKAVLLVMLCCLSALRERMIPLGVTCCVSNLPRAPARVLICAIFNFKG